MEFPTDIHGIGNAIEAVVWWVLGGCMLIMGYLKPHVRRELLIVSTTLIAFGFSDIVEIFTGAWWRPWWLFMWKGACVLTLCWQWYGYRNRQLAIKTTTEPKGS